jgi:hypothetical protein
VISPLARPCRFTERSGNRKFESISLQRRVSCEPYFLSRASLMAAVAHRINHARELHQHPVAGSLDDATMMFSDFGVNQLAAMPFEPFVRPFLIRAHVTRVARHIGSEDRGKATKGRHRS